MDLEQRREEEGPELLEDALREEGPPARVEHAGEVDRMDSREQ
jgi:hypothetical protein